MARNISLSLDPELLKAARALAAERGLSVNQLLTQELERLVRNAQAQAREQALANLNRGFHLGNMKFDRDALYEL